MQAAVDRLIIDARAVDADARCDLGVVAAHHADFWSVLAEEEERPFTSSFPRTKLAVDVSAEEMGDVVDILIGNIFDHTDRGVGFDLTVTVDGAQGVLTVTDQGDGFPDGIDPLARGESTKGTGLGLDIARRLAERLGGSITLDNCPNGGGARVTLRVPLSTRPSPS